MATLLHIDSAISPAGSASREVTAAFVKAWTEAHPDGKVVHRDLGAHPVPHLDFTAVSAGFSDPSEHTEEQRAAVALRDELAASAKDQAELAMIIDLSRNDLARVIALELDRVAIYGTGSSNQPLGLTNTTGIGSQTITTFGTFAEYIGMETDVATANADAGSLRYIINAAARGALKSTEKASNTAQFVYEDDQINGYPVIVSNQLANNDALFGDFSMMIMGMWSGLDLTVDPYAGATSGTVRIIALQDVDIAVKQAGAFCLGT